jgi:cytochrome c biogenesis protein CcmG, thiol:disulfide interchange protein DsbE
MKKRLTILSLAALAALLMAFPVQAMTNVGDVAPEFSLKTLDGETEINLSDYAGKVVYLDFWASWCGPCRRAFPEVKKLHAEYAEQGMEVLAISLDKSPSPAIKFMAQQDASFLALFDAGSRTAQAYGVRSIPTTIIVGPDGKVAYNMVGFNPNKVPEIQKTIDELLTQVELSEETASKESM